jgi:hypothetical protein
MKQHRQLILIFSIMIAALISGCSSAPKKQLKIKGFTLSYMDKFVAGGSLNEMQLDHPIKLSEEEVRDFLKSLVYEELSLFGKKKSVFFPRDLERIGRLLTKAIQRVPSHKIVHYELETPKGSTTGEVFASNNQIHWRFDSIKGLGFSGRSYTGGANNNWRMVPQSGQQYKAVKKLLGTQAQENWIFSKLHASSKRKKSTRKNNQSSRPSRRKAGTPLMSPDNAMNNSPARSIDPALKKKLEFLKDLHEKNLIDENEYDQKRKELLDTYL